MTENRKIAEYMFDVIRKFGFEPYDIQYGNGYFIFDHGEDSVIHFRVKGVWKHWKFGMWVNSEYLEDKYREEESEYFYKVVQIFAQHDTLIDKFKPSRSSLCVSYDAWDWDKYVDGTYRYPFIKLESMLNMMKRHPLICYAGFCGEYAEYYAGSFLAEYIKLETKDKLRALEEKLAIAIWYPWTLFKCHFARKAKCIAELTIHNFEKENPGWSTSYKYSVEVKFAKDATTEDETTWLDKWFHKWKYGKYGYYDYVVELDNWFTKEGMDGHYTYKLVCDLKDEKKKG